MKLVRIQIPENFGLVRNEFQSELIINNANLQSELKTNFSESLEFIGIDRIHSDSHGLIGFIWIVSSD